MPNELYHYGVLGMKWGIHKARSYAEDKNRYVRKQRDKIAESKYKLGEYDTNQYEAAKRRNRYNERRKNQKVIGETLKLSPKKGEKVSSIYNKYKKQAIRTIPNYKLKKGAKVAADVLYTIGMVAIDLQPGTAAAQIGRNVAIGLATGVSRSAANAIGRRATQNYLYKKKHKQGGSA
jgi:hypothetical protein